MIYDVAALRATPGVVPFSQRLALLRGVPGFSNWPTQLLESIATSLDEQDVPVGAVVVAEGDAAERLYVVVEGSAEVTAASPTGPALLANVNPGELFGEIALLMPEAHRQATVTATTPMRLLSLDAPRFHQALEAHPEARAALMAVVEEMLVAKFLKLASPFATLGPERLRTLAGRVEPLDLPAEAAIVKQGEHGDSCFLLRRGKVEVLLRGEAGTERRIATLTPGALFGEAALLLDAPRNATVRTLEPCSLLVLRRDALLEAIGAERRVREQVFRLLQLRARPQQVQPVEAHHRMSGDGVPVTILKQVRSRRYYQLSPQGWFIWQRLGGDRTLRDLTLDYLAEYKSFAPQAIVEVLAGLAIAGFILAPASPTHKTDPSRRSGRAWQIAQHLLDWQIAVPNVDVWLGRLYRAGIWLLFTRPAQLVLTVLALAGLLAFAAGHARAGQALELAGPVLLLILIPAQVANLLLHEAGHAFTVKAFGQTVHRMGIGWYWFAPVAFVDTSDMWLTTRWPRIAVSLAGPFVNLLLGGLAALGAWFASDVIVAGLLWQCALSAYLLVLANLNPLLEYDGYYVLMDWLDRPNLRLRALAWIGQGLVPALQTGGGLRGHWVDLIYGLGSGLYVGMVATLMLLVYRLLVEKWFARIVPAAVAAGIAWVLAAAVVVLAVARVVQELRGAKAAIGLR